MNKFPDHLLAARDNKNKVKELKPDILLKKNLNTSILEKYHYLLFPHTVLGNRS